MMGRKMCKDMHKEIRLEVDGKMVDRPVVMLARRILVLAGNP